MTPFLLGISVKTTKTRVKSIIRLARVFMHAVVQSGGGQQDFIALLKFVPGSKPLKFGIGILPMALRAARI